MECYVCKKEITSLSKASRLDVGGRLSLMGHDRCWAALNEASSPDPAPKPMGKTINKAYGPIRKHRPEAVAEAINQEVDFSEAPIGSTVELEGEHYVVGWNKKGLQPYKPSEQVLQAMKKGVR